MMSTANVRENLVDHVAIVHLLNQYTNCLNVGDWDTLVGLFAAESTWRVITRGEVEYEHHGARAIAEILKTSIEGGTRVMLQMNHAPVVDVDGDRATASTTMEAIYWAVSGIRAHRFAVYADELVRDADGEWRFTLREFRSRGTVTHGDVVQV